MSCNPREIIRKSELKERIRYQNGDTDDIIRVILSMDSVADQYINADAAECLIGSDGMETLRNIWRFVKGNVEYRADKRGKEVVKSPAALFAIGRGDCKSFSIAEVALLRALGFTGIRYRFAAYSDRSDFTHVYVVCKFRGRDVILDAVHTRFDEEVPYTRKKDIPAAKTDGSIQGIQTASKNEKKPSVGALFAIGLLAWAAMTWK